MQTILVKSVSRSNRDLASEEELMQLSRNDDLGLRLIEAIENSRSLIHTMDSLWRYYYLAEP